jgi:hypothetical protein
VPLDRVRLTAAKPGPRRHGKLRFARPHGSDSGSAPEDGELRSARPQGSDSGSAPEDDELRSARPRARTQPWPQPTVSASPDPGARTRPRLRKTDSTSTSEEPPHRPTQGTDRPRQQEAPSLPYPKLTQATGNKTGVPSGSLRQTSNDGAPRPMTTAALSPLTEARGRQQGLDSLDSCPSARPQRSSNGHDTTQTGCQKLSGCHMACT